MANVNFFSRIDVDSTAASVLTRTTAGRNYIELRAETNVLPVSNTSQHSPES